MTRRKPTMTGVSAFGEPAHTARRRTRGNGDGGIYQLPDGRYRWQATLGRDDKGKQIRRSGTAPTKREASRALTEVLAAQRKGLLSLPDATTLGEWLDLWLARRKPQVAPGTHEQYTFRLKHVPSRLRRVRLQDLRRTHIRQLAADLMAKSLSVSTARKVMAHLRAALDEAIEEEVLVINPAQGVRITMTVAERSRQTRKALTTSELRVFLRAAHGDALYPFFYTLFSLGLRRGEGLGLRWQDIDLASGEIRIEQQVKIEANRAVIGALKTAGSRRRLYASPDLLEILHAQAAHQQADRELAGDAWVETGLVFTTAIGTAVHPRNVNRAIYAICDAAELPHFSSHTARHTHITQRLRAGEKVEVVAAVAGHASPSITLDIYRHVTDDEKRVSTFSLRDQLATPSVK
ncbi:site-specific integrase [Deinococcus taeanensis]|uniref:tyrosine-type recombinase/integrase n=1 Tax=Deinococcus taeanensis TaxID=2737050 RepID=UPI001CDCF0FB|nr:site-specific integrase [Deinococcus taeanensis]UBV42605.1 site-specific integrase [Deinococcus taeanensis]